MRMDVRPLPLPRSRSMYCRQSQRPRRPNFAVINRSSLNATGTQGWGIDQRLRLEWTEWVQFYIGGSDNSYLVIRHHPGAGTHTYTVTVTDGNGCTDVATVDITINSNPSVSVSVTTQQCRDEAIMLDATAVEGSGANIMYSWSGPLSFSSILEGPSDQSR